MSYSDSHGCEIKSGSGLGTRLVHITIVSMNGTRGVWEWDSPTRKSELSRLVHKVKGYPSIAQETFAAVTVRGGAGETLEKGERREEIPTKPSMDLFVNMTWQSRHDYVANAWPSGSCHGYKYKGIHCSYKYTVIWILALLVMALWTYRCTSSISFKQVFGIFSWISCGNYVLARKQDVLNGTWNLSTDWFINLSCDSN